MISIFAKEAFLNINPHEPFRLRTKPVRGGHLQRVSSMIRGGQIAEKIPAKFNPTEGYENDVCIYVKPMVRKGDDFKFEGQKNYLDIVDGHNLGQVLLKHLEVGCIVCSKSDEKTMKSVIPNEIVYIPQHHCNFERLHRDSKEIKKIGMIGTEDAWQFIPYGLEEELKKRNIELVKFSKFFSRQDIVDFYMGIDMQLVWRPYKKLLSNPLKIVNAASFGIPSIALDEDTFGEVKGCYWSATNTKEIMELLDMLIEKHPIYKNTSERCLKISEFYHIDNVAEMYRRLDL